MEEKWLDGIAKKHPPARHHGGALDPKFVVVHHTAGRYPTDLQTLLGRAPRGPVVSCHYYVSRRGHVYQLLPHNVVGYHAGRSRWSHGGEQFNGLNHHSLGIELENLDGNKHPYTKAQMAALCEKLVPALVKTVPLLGDPDRWVGHQQVSPGRKIDPGRLFPWGLLKQCVWECAPEP